MRKRWKKLCPLVAAMLCMAVALAVCNVTVASAAQRDKVRIGFLKSEMFGYVDADDDLRGYNVHLSEAIGAYGDFDVEMSGYDTEAEMEDALRSGKVEVLVGVSRTESREREFIFTDCPILEESVILYTRNAPDAPTADNLVSRQPLRVGCVEGSDYLDAFVQYCTGQGIAPELVPFKNENDARLALDRGEVDACLTDDVTPPGYRYLASTVSLNSYMMFRADEVALRNRIDQAITQLNTDQPNYVASLYRRYIEEKDTGMAALAAQERAYLEAHPRLTVALVRGAQPIVVEKEDGSLGGVVPDYYCDLEEELGVTFDFVLYDTTQEAVDAVRQGKADVLGQYYGDAIIADKDGLYETEEYGSTDCARLTRGDFSGKVKTVAVTDRTAALLMDQLDKDLSIKAYPNIEACYQALMDRKVDAAVGSMTSVTWLINQHSLRGVSMTVLPDVTLGIHGAVSQDNRDLLFVLNKAIAGSQASFDQAVVENAASGSTDFRTTLENLLLGISPVAVGVLVALVVLLVVLIVIIRRANRRREAKLNREIDVDGLTGASSRRYGASLLEHEMQLFRRYGDGPLIGMFDIDLFKEKNDSLGHEYGDFVLKRVVEILRRTLRQSDAIIRWGGDEFIIVCPKIIGDGTDRILEKVVKAISGADFTLKGKGRQITISVGASFFQEDDKTIEDVLRRCDKALYEAKTVRNTYRIAWYEEAEASTDSSAGPDSSADSNVE